MQNKTIQTSGEARRSFLKKAAYAAPAVVILGGLTAPMSAHASIIFKEGTFNQGTADQLYGSEHYDTATKAINDGLLSYDYQSGTYVTTDKFNSAQFTDNSDLKAFFDALFNN